MGEAKIFNPSMLRERKKMKKKRRERKKKGKKRKQPEGNADNFASSPRDRSD